MINLRWAYVNAMEERWMLVVENKATVPGSSKQNEPHFTHRSEVTCLCGPRSPYHDIEHFKVHVQCIPIA